MSKYISITSLLLATIILLAGCVAPAGPVVVTPAPNQTAQPASHARR